MIVEIEVTRTKDKTDVDDLEFKLSAVIADVSSHIKTWESMIAAQNPQ